MNKISIIIPAYNVESYIRKSLDSVINQTYTNLEILCIDDGSTDASGIICDEYAKSDNRIRVIHKANGGLSSALNVGLQNFTGDFVSFLDSDDWIEPNMYEILYKALTENNVHLSVVNFTRDTGDISIIEAGREKIPSRVLTQKEMLLYIFRTNQYAGFYSCIWNKLYKADIIKGKNLFFDESLKISMDFKFLTELILSGEYTGIYIDMPLHHYLQRQGSLIRSDSTTNKVGRLRCLKEVVDLSVENGYSDITIWIKREHCYSASLLAEKALVDNNKELLLLMCSEIKLYLKEYIETNSEFPERIERILKLASAA